MLWRSIRDPVGPLAPGVYWRRRAVVAGLLVALSALVAVGVGTFGSGRTVREAAGARGSAPRALGSTPAPTSRPSAAATPSATPSSPGACVAASLEVTAAASAPVYPAGVLPELTLRVQNVGGFPCAVPLGGGASALVVYTGQQRVWASTDCDGGTRVLDTLAAGAHYQVTYAWDRDFSHPGCPAGTPAAQPGTYYVVAVVDGIRAAGSVFSLS